MSKTQTTKSSRREREKRDPIEEAISWANKHLSKSGREIIDLTSDFCDGTNFLILYQTLAKKQIPVPWKDFPESVHEKRKNIGAFLSLLQNNRYVKPNVVRPDDILWGELNATYTALRALNIYLDNGHLPSLTAQYISHYKATHPPAENDSRKVGKSTTKNGSNDDENSQSKNGFNRTGKSGRHGSHRNLSQSSPNATKNKHGSKRRGHLSNTQNGAKGDEDYDYDDEYGENGELFAGTADLSATIKSLNKSMDLSKSQEIGRTDENDANAENGVNGSLSQEEAHLAAIGALAGESQRNPEDEDDENNLDDDQNGNDLQNNLNATGSVLGTIGS